MRPRETIRIGANYNRKRALNIEKYPATSCPLQAPEHVGQGFSQGVKYFGHTLKSGVKGVVSKPMKGAKKGGAAGFMTGLGHGMVGLVAAPVSGTAN